MPFHKLELSKELSFSILWFRTLVSEVSHWEGLNLNSSFAERFQKHYRPSETDLTVLFSHFQILFYNTSICSANTDLIHLSVLRLRPPPKDAQLLRCQANKPIWVWPPKLAVHHGMPRQTKLIERIKTCTQKRKSNCLRTSTNPLQMSPFLTFLPSWKQNCFKI